MVIVVVVAIVCDDKYAEVAGADADAVADVTFAASDAKASR